MLKSNEFWESILFFKEGKFSCKCGCGLNNIHKVLVHKLNDARALAAIPFKLESASRCFSHNMKVLGSESSSHLSGLAVDIKISSSFHRFRIVQALLSCGFKRIGVYKDFIHVDINNDKAQSVVWC